MAIENEAQAIEALTSANAQDTGANQPVQPDTTQNADSTQVQDQSRIDPNSLNLDPQARAYIEQREREMQADYTRKTQEAAQQRKEAEQALEFINALNNDPNFAVQVHQTLAQALEQQGLLQQQQQAFQAQNADDQFVDPYMQKIQELENWKVQQEQQMRVQQAEAYINAGVNAIRSENPNYTDNDVKDILTMAFAFNGDVRQAHEAYKAINQRSIESYLAKKDSVPAELNQPSATGHAEIPPEGFKSLNDPRLEEAARQMLLNSGAQW